MKLLSKKNWPRKKSSIQLLAASISALSRDVKELKSLIQNPSLLFLRNDRDAARLCGFKSTYRFHLWAVARGLKPKIKKTTCARTVYKVNDLMKACEAEIREQGSRYNFEPQVSHWASLPVHPAPPHGQTVWHRLRGRGRAQGDEE